MFAGKHGFITLRDLFRWADRYRLEEQTVVSQDWLQHLVDDGKVCQGIFKIINLMCFTESLVKTVVFWIRLHVVGRTCEEARGRGHHCVHPRKALQEKSEH